MKKAKKNYEICYHNHLELSVGAMVEVLKSEPESSEWFGWHFCRDKNGKEGWISSDFLNLKTGQVKKDYSAKKLNASTGENFKIIHESCNWFWCQSSDGQEGWLPSNIF